MKRVVSVLMLVFFLFSALPMAGAAEAVSEERIELGDGYYLIAETFQSGARASKSISGSKPYTCYDDAGTALWKVTLYGTFTYTGSSATCTASSISTTIYDSSWSTGSKSASKSGSKAIGSATMKQSSNNSTVRTVPVSLSLSCSASGSLS